MRRRLEDSARVTYADVEWDRRAQELEFTQLSDLRAVADKWRNGLATLTGAVTTATVFKGTEVFADLAAWAVAAALFFLGLGLVALIAAGLLAMSASFGQPDRLINAGEDLREWTASATQKGARRLKVAQILTVIGVLGVASSTAVSWVGGAEDSPSTEILVDTNDGRSFCGAVVAGPPGYLSVKLPNDDVAVVRLDEVSTINPTECPR
jgi:hypothetical protein